MKTFKQFLTEASKDLAPRKVDKQFMDNYYIVQPIADWDYSMWDYHKEYRDIENGKLKDSKYFSDADKAMKDLESAIKEYPYGFSYSSSEIAKLKKRYEKAKEGFLIDAKAFNLVKVGEKQDIAIKKLSKGLNNREISKRFDPMTEDEIMEEIEEFQGVVKIRGAMDMYVNFENGKVVQKYF